jgi:hypothetical protein
VFNLLICPSTQVPRIYGAKHLKLLNEGVNEGWNSAITSYLFTVLVHSLMIMWGLDDLHSRKPEFLLVRDFELKEPLKSAQGILQGAGPVGCYYKVLTRRFVTGSSFLAQSAVTTPTYTGCGLQITS